MSEDKRCNPCGFIGHVSDFEEGVRCPICGASVVVEADEFVEPAGFYEMGENPKDPGLTADSPSDMSSETKKLMTESRRMGFSRDPDFMSQHIRAWVSKKPGDDENKSLISRWFIWYPNSHPLWSWWMWSLITLEDVEGLPPAKKDYPEARYEIMCHALDPGKGRPDIDGDDPIHFLQPVDLVKQFTVDTDNEAIVLSSECVREMVWGLGPPPDTDYRRSWGERIDQAAYNARERPKVQ